MLYETAALAEQSTGTAVARAQGALRLSLHAGPFDLNDPDSQVVANTAAAILAAVVAAAEGAPQGNEAKGAQRAIFAPQGIRAHVPAAGQGTARSPEPQAPDAPARGALPSLQEEPAAGAEQQGAALQAKSDPDASKVSQSLACPLPCST